MRRRCLLLLVLSAALFGTLTPLQAAAPVRGHLFFIDPRGVLATLRPDGGGYRTTQVSGWTSDIEISPNGRWVAFTRQPNELLATSLLEVWVARSDLSGAHAVAALPGLFASQPTWSPDSGRLALVVGYPAGYFGIGYQAHLWVMARDGSGVRPAAALPGAAEQPTWSPRGSDVAFVMDGQETSAAIAVVDVDATPAVPRTLSPLGTVGVTKPHWSPTGDRLAFMDAANLYVVRADGSGLRRVSEGNSYPWNGGSVWSPDGRRLAYCLSSSGYFFGGSSGTGPWIVQANGSGPARLYDEGPCFAPAWSPDGRALAYVQPGTTTGNLVVQDLTRRRLVELAPASGLDVVWSAS